MTAVIMLLAALTNVVLWAETGDLTYLPFAGFACVAAVVFTILEATR